MVPSNPGTSVPDSFGQLFPELAQDQLFLQQLLSVGEAVNLPSGQHICLEGASCKHLAFVLNGSGRIYKLGASGREITLYRVEAGDCCILTLSCIHSARAFPAFAVCESPLQAVIVPASIIRQWMDSEPVWRNYAWNLIADRLADVINLVEEVTFRRMDERLADYLEQSTQPMLKITHQQIAADLGTSREVISRLLKDMQQKGKLELGRGWIRLSGSEHGTQL